MQTITVSGAAQVDSSTTRLLQWIVIIDQNFIIDYNFIKDFNCERCCAGGLFDDSELRGDGAGPGNLKAGKRGEGRGRDGGREDGNGGEKR